MSYECSLDWDHAIDYLDTLIEEYREIGCIGLFGLTLTLYPLKNRVNSGERTPELYEAIMDCK